MNQNLEFEIDQFTSNIHALCSYKDVAEQVAGECLGFSASTLHQRDQKNTRLALRDTGDAASTKDVLRTLSRVIDR